jgi:arsenate reductase-like glutaredoxin family protein
MAFVVAASPLAGCRKKVAPAVEAVDAGAPSLPALSVRDDSTGLTFSYLTVGGDFKLAKAVGDVPYESRDAVRVWVDATADGVANPTYLADLRSKRGDGTYKVEVVPLKVFDDLAADRRGKVASAAGAAGATGSGGGAPAAVDPKSASVVIFGADWCKPCHQAEAYFKSKGVDFVHKNVDDPVANEEMRDILANAGIRTTNIPIIVVRGEVLVGFDPGSIDRALAKHPAR